MLKCGSRSWISSCLYLDFGFVVSSAGHKTIQIFCLLQNTNLGKEVTFLTFKFAFQQRLFKCIHRYKALKCRQSFLSYHNKYFVEWGKNSNYKVSSNNCEKLRFNVIWCTWIQLAHDMCFWNNDEYNSTISATWYFWGCCWVACVWGAWHKGTFSSGIPWDVGPWLEALAQRSGKKQVLQGSVSLLLQKMLFSVQSFQLVDIVLDILPFRNICPCCGFPCYPDVVAKAGRWETSV